MNEPTPNPFLDKCARIDCALDATNGPWCVDHGSRLRSVPDPAPDPSPGHSVPEHPNEQDATA